MEFCNTAVMMVVLLHLAIRRLCGCCTTGGHSTIYGCTSKVSARCTGLGWEPAEGDAVCAAVLQGKLLETLAIVKGSELHYWAREVRNGGAG